MSLQSHISPDSFVNIPSQLAGSAPSSENRPQPLLLYFIPGNPGLISFYHSFLSLLATSPPNAHHEEVEMVGSGGQAPAPGQEATKFKLDSSQCVIAGFSHGGFEIEPSEIGGLSMGTMQQRPESISKLLDQCREAFPGPIYSLKEQVGLNLYRIKSLISLLYKDYGAVYSASRPPQIVLMGHSVGAYIALEIIRICHEQQSQKSYEATDVDASNPPFRILSAFLLTPTIIDISQSPSGRFATPLLTRLSFLSSDTVQHLVNSLVHVLPDTLLGRLITAVTGIGPPCREIIAAFLRSPRGVQEALAMSADEMREISHDAWGPEVWGQEIEAALTASKSNAPGNETSIGMLLDDNDSQQQQRTRAPKLVFYFAQKDHWVADKTRDEIVRLRGRLEEEELDKTRKGKAEGAAWKGRRENGRPDSAGLHGNNNVDRDWRPKMIVEKEGRLVHAWCIDQSSLVAAQVRSWLVEVQDEEK